MTSNPFVEFNEREEATSLTYPKFPHTKVLAVRISEETEQRLQKLAQQFTTTGKLSDLFDQFGCYLLNVSRPTLEIDPESNVTTEQCRESGFEDGLNGNPQYFLKIFGTTLTDAFQDAYMRGFYEGNYIRNARK